MRFEKYGCTRHWAVYDDSGELICLTVYRKGAAEIVRRLEGISLSELAVQSKPSSGEIKKLLTDIKAASRRIQKLANELLPQI